MGGEKSALGFASDTGVAKELVIDGRSYSRTG